MRTQSRELVVVVPEDLDYTGIFDDLFERYASEHRLTSVNTSNMGSLFKLRYMVKLKNERDEKSFIRRPQMPQRQPRDRDYGKGGKLQ